VNGQRERLPVGTWLVHDPEDERLQRDYSVWRKEPGRCHLMIDWFGSKQDRYRADDDMPARFIWVMLTDEHLAQLEMAAVHGQFRPLAIKIWERIMR
jgi:hypothetical protein